MPSLPSPRLALAVASLSAAGALAHAAEPPPAPPGLLFYLSGSQGTTADYAANKKTEPNFSFDVTPVADGAKGPGLRCANTQRLSYWAPGNIYAQRGTLSFFWRPRDPVGPTEFPVFRVGYADHSSWDMTFLRIDYNGHGFDAFVTDASLSRTRVSVTLDPFPAPDKWIHLAFSWDETHGIRFYINGKLAAKSETTAVYNAALDQFGPHSRIISPYQVQSDYNFVRGGDIDEVRIYDRMLTDANVATLAKGDAPNNLPELAPRDLSEASWRSEWWHRYGWDRQGDVPPYLANESTSIRKVEIHDAYDLKRWYWKACDGIRETTWAGVFNRSRLPGRNDYFQLPDWDCYSLSGKSVTFTMPEEPWNHLEISGSAWGTMNLLRATGKDAGTGSPLFERPQGQEKTIHHLAQPIVGQKIRFDNVMQEEPIGELSAYNVTAGREPAGNHKLVYRLGTTMPKSNSVAALNAYIAGRHPADERATLVAEPAQSGAATPLTATPNKVPVAGNLLPLVHILVPCESNDPAYKLDAVDGGLDGIAIDIPALHVAATHGDYFPLNIQVKDPLLPLRNMLDFTFSVKPGEARTVWLDLRDRILPASKGLYLTIAGAGADFNASSLVGTELRVIFKPKAAARAEHEIDRFTQARDVYAMIVEEHPHSEKYNLWNQFEADINDLLRVNPQHYPGWTYWAIETPSYQKPAYKQSEPPAGVPLWAYRQVEVLGGVKRFVNWWIDHRQVENGEFGGGLSDDTDLTNTWPGVALMGCDPDKLLNSLHLELEAIYRQNMFTHGISTIQLDELHSYEDGINCLGQNLILDYGNPKQLERAMENARGVDSVTAINPAGHRHFRSAYYSGTRVSTDGVWGWQKPYSFLVLQPSQLLVDYNGNPTQKKILLELADGLLAHHHKGGEGSAEMGGAVEFKTDKEAPASRGTYPWPTLWSAWKWTGQDKYLAPIKDRGTNGLIAVNANTLDLLNLRDDWEKMFQNQDSSRPNSRRRPADAASAPRNASIRSSSYDHFEWQLSGKKEALERLYERQIEEISNYNYINTEGSLWIDRVGVPYTELQRARLGGIALVRNGGFPGHTVSWRFQAPANDQSVAILIPDATATKFTVIAYNLDTAPVKATMTGWNIDPGMWEVSQGVDSDNDDKADRDVVTTTVPFERSKSLDLTFPARASTVLTFHLKTPGKPYWERPDLGLDRSDVQINGREVRVTIHSLGSIPTPSTIVVLRDRQGKVIGTEKLASIAAPLDLIPKTADVSFTLPEGASAEGGSVEIDPDHAFEEITQRNNQVSLQ